MRKMSEVNIGYHSTDCTAVVKWMKSTGTCDLCVDRLLGKEFKLDSSTPEPIAVDVKSVEPEESSDVCNICVGLLQTHCNVPALEEVGNRIASSGFEFADFAFALSVPLSMVVRERVMWTTMIHKFPEYFQSHPIAFDEIYAAKDVWKRCVASYFESTLKCGVSIKSTFQVNITYKDCAGDDYCSFLATGKSCNGKRQSRFSRKRQQTMEFALSKPVVLNLLERLNFNDLDKLTPCPPNQPARKLTLDCVGFTQGPLYIGGRYNKYSRTLSQTPWVIDGERRLASSVQELISAGIEPRVKADELRFSASGREDIDVRTLGNGRPFVIECINPRRITFTREDMETVTANINASTSEIAVNSLQIVTKADTAILKQGEEEKRKTYLALCYSPGGAVAAVTLSALNAMSEVVISQRTPVRVLHRRTNAVRERVIHSMRTAGPSVGGESPRHFTLTLSAQAGTYIKEFVHGDFGRTRPSLGTLLGGVDVDILELDVLQVHLDWPPTGHLSSE